MTFDPRGFRGYLFDLDGTLIRTARISAPR